MSRFYLALGLHNHQPVGNFDHVFAAAHHDAYRPFIELVTEYPKIRFSLHQSGILWEWQRRHDESYLAAVKRLVDRGQVELLTGGFYEPILTAVPERDACTQIRKLTDYLRHHFEASPRGLWLTERIWEPHLPRLLADSGVGFLPIDDTHFLYAGMEPRELFGPFVTEDAGSAVRLLPIQKRLRYLIPFGDVHEVIDQLRRWAEEHPGGVAVYADDGEKFGVWPNTNQHVYGDRWLRRFFEALVANEDWLSVIPLGEAAARPAAGRAYLPTASYAEMLHWALPTTAGEQYEAFEHWLQANDHWDDYGRFVRGGHWRGFLAKYPESNWMHKRMLALSQRLDRLSTSKVTHPDLSAAYEALFAAQCNCPYWHGVFGGLYLPHIREAIMSSLVTGEKLARSLEQASGTTTIVTDLDCDGTDEIRIESNELSAVVAPSTGGSLVFLSHSDPPFEFADTLSRRREGYHAKLRNASDTDTGTASIHDRVVTKESGLDAYLVDDTYLRRSALDHLLAAEATPDSFLRGTLDGVRTLAHQRFELFESGDGGAVVRGRCSDPGLSDATLTKRYRVVNSEPSLTIDFELVTAAPFENEHRIATEFNFSLQAGHADDRYVEVNGDRPDHSWLDGEAVHADVDSVALIDDWRKLALGMVFDGPVELWRQPLFTVSSSEAGFERVYQGTTLLLVRAIPAGTTRIAWRVELTTGRPDAVRTRLVVPAAARR